MTKSSEKAELPRLFSQQPPLLPLQGGQRDGDRGPERGAEVPGGAAEQLQGGVGARRHADHPHHTQQRDHAQPAHQPLEAFIGAVASARAAGKGVGQGLVHVPDQHRPHGAQVGIPGGGR